MLRFIPALLLVACKSDATLVLLSDANNYAFESSIAATSQVVAAGEDTNVDWSGLTTDLLGEPMDPVAEVSEVRIVRFGSLTQEEILADISNDALKQSDVTGFVSYAPLSGETTAPLTSFSLFGTYVDPPADLQPGMGTFLVSAVSGVETYRMFTFIEPTTDAPIVPITLSEDSAVLSYTVDLDSGEPVARGKADAITVDWSELTVNGSGNSFDLSDIDTLLVGRYTTSLADLESDFLHLDLLADEIYEINVGGLASYDLSELTAEDGSAFGGFQGDGIWLIALRCSTCINPSPPFLGIFD